MARTWYDLRGPDLEESVLGPLLERRATEMPDRVFARRPTPRQQVYNSLCQLVYALSMGRGDLLSKP